MSCERCQELCVKYVIQAPDQLRKAIRIARNALDEGTLSEIETTNDWNQYSFRECAEKMVWGDIVEKPQEARSTNKGSRITSGLSVGVVKLISAI